MGKQQKKARKEKASSSTQDIFGRPADVPLEAVFMNKLRQGKLQSIIAQSQAQIQCNKFVDNNPEHYANRSLKSNDDEDNFSKEKIIWIVKWFKKYISHPTDFQLLWNSYRRAQQTFQFKEIQEGQQIPQYLFLDECDLSYILYTILQSQDELLKEKSQFSNTQLFFLQMLSFASRNVISFKIIQALQSNFTQILDQMEGFIQKIHLQYISSLQKEADTEKQLKGQQVDKKEKQMNKSSVFEQNSQVELPITLRKGDFFKNLPSQESIEAAQGQLKRKLIKKQEKKKMAGRPKSKAIPQVDIELGVEGLQQVLTKLLSHIAWSYLYIYPECIQKKKRLASKQ